MTSKRLSDMHGFSPRNLKYMRAFAALWPDRTMVQQPAAQIPVLIDDSLKHDFYVETCGVEGWSER
jgi:hypothetical protein